MSRSRRAANYGRKIGAHARNVRARAEEKKREQAPAPADAPAAKEAIRENPHDRMLRRIREANEKAER